MCAECHKQLTAADVSRRLSPSQLRGKPEADLKISVEAPASSNLSQPVRLLPVPPIESTTPSKEIPQLVPTSDHPPSRLRTASKASIEGKESHSRLDRAPTVSSSTDRQLTPPSKPVSPTQPNVQVSQSQANLPPQLSEQGGLQSQQIRDVANSSASQPKASAVPEDVKSQVWPPAVALPSPAPSIQQRSQPAGPIANAPAPAKSSGLQPPAPKVPSIPLVEQQSSKPQPPIAVEQKRDIIQADRHSPAHSVSAMKESVNSAAVVPARRSSNASVEQKLAPPQPEPRTPAAVGKIDGFSVN